VLVDRCMVSLLTVLAPESTWIATQRSPRKSLHTYHNAHEAQLTQLVIPPSRRQLISLRLTLRIQQDLNRIVRRRVRRVDASTKELQKGEERPRV